MNQQHRFILEPYNGTDTRFMCPNCRHRTNTFARYIDTETQTYLADHVGMCDRKERCAYHFPPKDFFKTNPDKRPKGNPFPPVQPKQDDVITYDVMHWDWLEETLRCYEHNYFMFILNSLFGEEQAEQLAQQYHIGTSKHWYGSNIFWQVDINNQVRAGKIMLYSPDDCKRVKEPFHHITWVHAVLSQKSRVVSLESKVVSNKSGLAQDSELQTQDSKIKQCFFGEHLLKGVPEKSRTVCIVESEKTAIIASVYHPNCIWLASGSLDGLNLEKCKMLKDRKVVLYPDINGYDKWREKARELNARMPTTTFLVNDYLERTATPEEQARGIDIADRWIDEMLAQWEMEREWGLR
ncbi:DUF6371 domain-containing protein [Mucilaginibacter sp. McL0603]|uniref:DUF6371 domain-containing protein n=1 Tax=Mucilaginibacter sp. McL0603 TaxID=3415670 RepID=UPI003CF62E78